MNSALRIERLAQDSLGELRRTLADEAAPTNEIDTGDFSNRLDTIR